MSEKIIISEAENGQYVTDVAITRLSVTVFDDASYGLELNWELNGGRIHDTEASYEVDVYCGDDNKVGTYPVTVDKINDLKGTVSGMKLDTSNKEKPFSVLLVYIKDNDRKESELAEMPVYGVSSLTGEYFNGIIEINWDSSYDSLPYICCDVYGDNCQKKIYEVSKTNTHMQISLSEYPAAVPINADIYSTDGDRIYGIVQKLKFFPCGITLTSFDRNADSLTAEFDLYCSDEESSSVAVYFCIIKDGTVLRRFDAASLTAVSGMGTGKISFKAAADKFFSAILPSYADNSSLGAIIEYRGALTKNFSKMACLPLMTPVLTVSEYVSDGVMLSADYPSSAPVIEFYGSNAKSYYSAKMEIKLTECEAFSVRPVFCIDGCKCYGISSDTISVFCEHFHAGQDTDGSKYIEYCQFSDNNEIVLHRFVRELFCSHLKEAVSSENNIISLEPCSDDALYVLKVSSEKSLSADDFNSELNGFYRKLFGIKSEGAEENYIIPSGFYMLSDAVIRLCRCRLSDILALSRNFVPAKRCCAVLPEDMLRIETSVYTAQTDSYSDNISGYSLACTAEYYAALSGNGNGGAIVFDQFVSNMAKGMSASISAVSNPKLRLSGILDLAENAEKPYLYLVYPINYYSSDMPSSVYPYDNVVLMGSISYPALLDELNDVSEHPEHMADKDNVPFFSGRSTVTICISVYINGTQQRVPLGTSVYTLLTQCGLHGGSYRMFRLNAQKKYCPIFTDDTVSAADIVLISGDRIEV